MKQFLSFFGTNFITSLRKKLHNICVHPGEMETSGMDGEMNYLNYWRLA